MSFNSNWWLRRKGQRRRMLHHLRVSAWFWKEQASEERRLCQAVLLQAVDRVSTVGGTRLWRAVRWRTWELGRWNVQPVVVGGGGGWRDVISEQVWVRNNRILNVLNFSITISITFTYNFCQALVCIFHWLLTVNIKLKPRSSELWIQNNTKLNRQKCQRFVWTNVFSIRKMSRLANSITFNVASKLRVPNKITPWNCETASFYKLHSDNQQPQSCQSKLKCHNCYSKSP